MSRYVGNKSTFRSVANCFDMSKSTLHKCHDRVMEFLLSIAPQVIHFPSTDEEKNIIANEFEAVINFYR